MVDRSSSVSETPIFLRQDTYEKSYSVTCVDPRCVPEAFFGPDLQAAVHRNGGGRATDDVVRTLNLLRALVHMKTVVVVHHTGEVLELHVLTGYLPF